MKPSALLVLLAGLAAGCAAQLQPIDASEISQVQNEIKREIGVYTAATGDRAGYWNPAIKQWVTPASSELACGSGNIGFKIVKIQADLQTTANQTSDINAGISVPMLPSGITPSANFDHSIEQNNSQELIYNIWPIDDPASVAALHKDWKYKLNSQQRWALLQQSPIALVLINMRSAMLRSAMRQDPLDPSAPIESRATCVRDFDSSAPGSDPGNTVTLGLTVTKQMTASGKLSFKIINLGLSRTAGSTRGHTITVYFKQDGLDRLIAYAEDMNAKCGTDPFHKTRSCLAARKAYDQALGSLDEQSGTADDDVGIGIEMKNPRFRPPGVK